MTSVKLLFITRKYPPAIGGMEMFAKDLSDALGPKIDLRLIKWSGYGRIQALLIAVPSVTARAFSSLLKDRADIIHAQDGVLAPVAWLLSRLFRKPFTVVIHGLDITFTNPLFHLAVPWAVRRANAVFCISQSAADEVLKRGVDKNKVFVIPLAVNDILYDINNTKSSLHDALSLPSNTKLLLTVGRLTKRKGVAWFIANPLPDLVKRFPELIYLVVGDGKDRPDVEMAIERAGMAEHVRLLGRVEGELYRQLYNGADIFVMPNINVPGDMEGFGLVNLEAALCELPVVAANTEGIRDAVADGKNGVLVPVANAEAFQNQIIDWLEHPEKSEQFGRQARQYTLRTYNWPLLADRYIEQYRKLL